MPARQPFTALCQTLRYNRPPGWFDLHMHTVHSDGLYTPDQVVELARRSGLAGIAITDHDTLSGVAEAEEAARRYQHTDAGRGGLEIIPGVEITAEFQGRELHLLGYFIRLDDESLLHALERLRVGRRARFAEMLERLRAVGVTFDPESLPDDRAGEALGRRHLANLLVKSQRVGSIREAFSRYLSDRGGVAVAKTRLPVAEAIELVHAAGGVAAWAHPSYDALQAGLPELAELGLDAVEADYPTRRPGQVKTVRQLAAGLGLAVTGGSDCHGPDPARSAIGARGVSRQELEALRSMCRGVASGRPVQTGR